MLPLVSQPSPDALFGLTGAVTAADLPDLRARLAVALRAGDVDLLLDGRDVTSFEDGALPAFTAARRRAKSQHHRVVALDHPDGPLTASLRRTGLIFRLPVYADHASATAAIADDRAAIAAKGRPVPVVGPPA